ncbi:flagellar hook-length control protein FliK [Paenibacillus sp. MMS20-IR301]|uniref:flagellar hook-length control protein FliK n=1 Tax=Paenibacillus sp. MMS20-IR301 TaxID=2895946 RepID=UPI0028E878FE|nr:flagellar hook-length control protein FliK [Paenibacillus sp. MMS20-IR301]WNS44791.1 flagellar hook-length control protein FliK [Paenibacillus sp. MMS20-IR301]
MSLIMQTLTAGNLSANGSSTAAGTNGTPAAGSAAGFAATLVQSMTGTAGAAAKGTETPVLGNLASLLQGLLSAAQTAEGDTGAADVKKGDLLEGLARDMEALDTSLEADPALLAALQGWLLQTAALLSGGNAAVQEDGAEGNTAAVTAGLSPLAQSADTLRFAVQDELNSLVGLIQDAAASGNEETAAKGAALLNQFSAILAESAPAGSKTQSKASKAEESVFSVKQTAIADNKPETAVKGNAVSEVRTLLQAAVQTDKSAQASVAAGTAVIKPEESPELVTTGLAAATKTAGDPEEAFPAAKAPTGESEVVTAGQLSLRHGITAPLKAEAAPVPVQQFAQEMSSFISGRLEIVKKGGVAEATITLFPENLGQVDVKITMQNGNLVAQFLTQHNGTKDILEQQMNQLRMALQAQGLQVEKLEVTQNSSSPQSQWTGQQGQQAGTGGQQQQGRRSRERQEDSGDALLAAELNGEWKDWAMERQQANLQNGGFSAKA